MHKMCCMGYKSRITHAQLQSYTQVKNYTNINLKLCTNQELRTHKSKYMQNPKLHINQELHMCKFKATHNSINAHSQVGVSLFYLHN